MSISTTDNKKLFFFFNLERSLYFRNRDQENLDRIKVKTFFRDYFILGTKTKKFDMLLKWINFFLIFSYHYFLSTKIKKPTQIQIDYTIFLCISTYAASPA